MVYVIISPEPISAVSNVYNTNVYIAGVLRNYHNFLYSPDGAVCYIHNLFYIISPRYYLGTNFINLGNNHLSVGLITNTFYFP